MRKQLFPLIVAVLGLIFMGVACTVEELAPEQNGNEQDPVVSGNLVTISASLEQALTKTLLGDSNTVCWSSDDQIRVFNASNPGGEVFTLISGAGSTSAVFSGNGLSGDGPFYAVYPASAAGTLTEGVVSVTIPADQVYTADSFGNGNNISASKADELTEFTFKNVGGAIRFSITGQKTVKYINLFTKGEEPLNGSAYVSFSGDVPALSWVETQSGDAPYKVSLNCGGTGVGLSPEGTDFYLVLPAGALSDGFTIEVVDSDLNVMVKNVTGESALIERSKIRPMPSFGYTPQYKNSFLSSEEVSGAFNDVLADGSFSLGCVYSEETGQYAYKNNPTGDNPSRYLRIQDWDAGFALGLTTPYELNAGDKVSVKVDAVGVTGISSSDAVEMKVLKKIGNRAWLVDPDSGNGFIMMLVED